MAIKALNSIGGFSIGEIPTDIISANGDINAPSLAVSGESNLGPIGNVIILGGTANQIISTDGTGNLSFINNITNKISNGTSNISIPVANGNVNISSNGHANVLVVSGTGVYIDGETVLTGNLTVTGNITYVNVDTLDITDPIIQLGGGPNGTPLTTNDGKDRGTLLQYFTTQPVSAFMGWKNSEGNFIFGSNVTDVSSAITVNTYGNVVANVFLGNVNGTFVNVANIVSNNATVNLELRGNTANFTGNINSANANLGNLVQANFVNVASNVSIGLNLSGNTANFSGNINSANANLGNLARANFVIVSSNLVSNNATVNLELQGNTANFTGNINSANANLGNVAQANNVTVSSNLSVNLDISGNTANFSGNINSRNANLGNLVQSNYVAVSSNLVSNNVTVTLELQGNSANFSGSFNSANANLGNVAQANNVTVSSNLSVNLDISGNTANFSGNLVALSNLNTNNISGRTTSVSISAAGTNQNINLIPSGNGSVDVYNHIISNLHAPISDFDAATKAYVDSVAQGLYIHAASQAATDNTLDFYSGGIVSYYQPGPEGVNASLETTGTFYLIDGVDITTVGTRILVKNEVDPNWNGIYTYFNPSALIRATDYDSEATAVRGSYTFIEGGSTNKSTSWVQTSVVVVIGNDPIIFAQFSAAGQYQAGTGLTLLGTVFSVNAQQDQITQVGILTELVVSGNANVGNLGFSTGEITGTGNITAGYLFGNGSQLIGISTDTIYNGSSNVSIPILNGNVITSVDGIPNIFVVSTSGANLAGNLTLNYDTDGQLIISQANPIPGYFDTTITFGLLGRTQVGNSNIDFHSSTSLNSYDSRISASGGNTVLGSGNINVFAYSTTFSGAAISDSTQTNKIFIGNTIIFAANTETTSTNKTTIAQYVLTGTDIVGIEFFVKSHDSAGAKYSMSKVHAVTDGTNVDYTTFGTVTLGSDTGLLSVATATGTIALQVIPTSSNSTVWTTQYRLI